MHRDRTNTRTATAGTAIGLVGPVLLLGGASGMVAFWQCRLAAKATELLRSGTAAR
jgi:hypothetical protein